MSGITKLITGIFSGLFGGDEPVSAPPPAPAVEPPAVMPLPDDDAVAKARKRSIAAQMRRRGRQSTIMTQTDPVSGGSASDPLGG